MQGDAAKATKLGLRMSLHDAEQLSKSDQAELIALVGGPHMPIVITHDEAWCGYEPAKLDALASKLAQAQ